MKALVVLLLIALPAAAAPKEWTMLTYLNGNNNLDTFGAGNINQMEQVGSTDQIDVVVQWASESQLSAKRMLVQKDNDRSVTSPVLQELRGADMGDWRTLVDFIRWGVERFPAKRYFINIWSHGTGWREPDFAQDQGPYFAPGIFHPLDISPDDKTGHAISTRELGLAMIEAARIMGHKVDLYASDACLMSMIEIAAEMADSVEVFAGSQATEPADGWPYATFLRKWNPLSGARDVARILAQTYIEAYKGGEFGKKEATFSALDLNQIAPVLQALLRVREVPASALKSVVHFTERDYVDLGDLAAKLSAREVTDALRAFVLTNQTTPRYSRASGVSIWGPADRDLFDRFSKEYFRLKFHAATGWGDTLRGLF